MLKWHLEGRVLMKGLFLILTIFCVSSRAGARGQIYASPTGKAGAAGTYADPYDLATGMAKASRFERILLLKQGLYVAPATIGRIGRRTHIEAAPGERPIFQTGDGYAPSSTLLDSTTIVGVWFGGREDAEQKRRHGTIVLSKQDSLNRCVFWGHDKGCIVAASDASRILNCLFVRNLLNSSWPYHEHVIYLSDSNSGQWSRRDIIYRNVAIKAPCGYAWHLWHFPSYVEVKRNFAARVNWFAACPPQRDNGWPTARVYFRDNIYWSNDSGYVNPVDGSPTIFYGINIDQAGVTGRTNHELVGKPTPAPQGKSGATCMTAYTYGGSGCGDSIWFVGPNLWHGFGCASHPTLGTSADLPTWIGKSQAQMDSAVSRLEQYFTQGNNEILTDRRIMAEWNVITTALDTWGGYLPAQSIQENRFPLKHAR